MEPLLKWAGGKRWQVPLLKRIWYRHRERRLVEPFCGALSVTLGLEPDRALLNDVNPHLINFYLWLQRGLECDIDLDVADYAHNREWFNALIADGHADSREAALLFYYLNRFGFNGLCRFNKSGEFNVPVGRASGEVRPIPTRVARITLMRYEFMCGDFRKALEHVTPDDFIYADPPYDDGFTQYSGDEFTWDDQKDLAWRLAQHDGPAIVTNHATDRVLDLYRGYGFTLTLLDAPRRIAASGDRSPAKEVLASNFPVDPTLLTALTSYPEAV